MSEACRCLFSSISMFFLTRDKIIPLLYHLVYLFFDTHLSICSKLLIQLQNDIAKVTIEMTMLLLLGIDCIDCYGFTFHNTKQSCHDSKKRRYILAH